MAVYKFYGLRDKPILFVRMGKPLKTVATVTGEDPGQVRLMIAAAHETAVAWRQPELPFSSVQVNAGEDKDG